MGKIKRIIKSNPWIFSTMKQVLLYVRYGQSIFVKNKYKGIKKLVGFEMFEIKEHGSHCYFGYYDKSPISPDGKYAVCLKVKDGYRPKECAEVCLINLETKQNRVIASTTTWNWQQGCMLQWVDDETVSYNCYDEKDNTYQTCWVNVHDVAKKRFFKKAAYSYNSSFSKFLSLNFFRLDLYAKGYGYPYDCDSMELSSDGIWESDVETGETKLILSLREVMDYSPKDYQQCQHYINHVAYTPDNESIIFIHRWQLKGGEFVSRLLLFNLKYRQLETLLDNKHVSHYCWKTEDVLTIFATNSREEKGYMNVNIKTKATSLIDGLPSEDGHPSYSNDRNTILTDTYPNKSRKQYLFLYDVNTRAINMLDVLWSPFRYFNDERCDLHPRWSVDNKYICVDNTASGYRGLKIYKL